jgi:hypothetical protein
MISIPTTDSGAPPVQQEDLKSRSGSLASLGPPHRLTALRSGVELQVKRGGPHGLLLVAREAGEAVGESIGDPKFRAISHASVRPT